jgi:hypothetical protein
MSTFLLLAVLTCTQQAMMAHRFLFLIQQQGLEPEYIVLDSWEPEEERLQLEELRRLAKEDPAELLRRMEACKR